MARKTLTDDQRVAARARSARYRDRHRDKIRVQAREYSAQRRRALGTPVMGSPESSDVRRKARKATGAEHGNWKGDGVGYVALHTWVQRHKPKTGTCANCGSQPETNGFRKVGTEWANISGEYRRDLSDWRELCAPCHRKEHARGLVHGTSTGYTYYRCRCDQCRAANTARKREYLQRKRTEVS